MSLRKKLNLILTNLIILLLFVVMIELGFRVVLGNNISDHKEYRLSRPAPYTNSTYFSEQFINESFSQPGGMQKVKDKDLYVPKNYKGEFFNVRDNRRVTTDSPKHFKNNIYIFGGSTIYSSEVPDSYTIPSILQRLINNKHPNSYKVINMGITSIGIKQQNMLLDGIKLNKNDIVIFKDGDNEIHQIVMYGNNSQSIIGHDKNRPLWQKLLAKTSKSFVSLRYFLNKANANFKINNLDDRLAYLEKNYEYHIRHANRFTSRHNALFFHFVQPNIFTLAKHSQHEDILMQSGLISSQVKEAFSAGFPILEVVSSKLSTEGIHTKSLADALNHLKTPTYLDFAHVTEEGNKAIAKRIFEEIQPHLSNSN